MKHWKIYLFVFSLGISGARDLPAASKVGTWETEWKDEARHRAIPVKIYYPMESKPHPVLLFSHGLGGTREGYGYLGESWASQGYVSIHLQHIGSDDAVWKGKGLLEVKATMKTALTPQNSQDRYRDVHFALDQLDRLNREAGPLQGKIDAQTVGLAGHSFGAWTTLTGLGVSGPGMEAKADPRIKAAIAMSSPWVRGSSGYDQVKTPCLHMTGTEDDGGALTTTTVADRRKPFDLMQPGPQFLITFQGGDHMVFSGRSRLRPKATDAHFHDLILELTGKFWDAYVKGDAKARSWLEGAEPAQVLGRDAVWEKRNLSP
jgi:predicted dienelactone hydrolase